MKSRKISSVHILKLDWHKIEKETKLTNYANKKAELLEI